MNKFFGTDIFNYIFGTDVLIGIAEFSGDEGIAVSFDITQTEFEGIVTSYLNDDLAEVRNVELIRAFSDKQTRDELFTHFQSFKPERKFVGFIARDDQAIWGFGTSLAKCKKSAIYWRNGGKKYGDATLEGLEYEETTAMALAAVEAKGSDAERDLRFNRFEDKCWHKSES